MTPLRCALRSKFYVLGGRSRLASCDRLLPRASVVSFSVSIKTEVSVLGTSGEAGACWRRTGTYHLLPTTYNAEGTE
jgi:hypothetical protein